MTINFPHLIPRHRLRRSEWSPGVLVGAFSGVAVRDCPALSVRDLNAVTEREVRARMRLADRGTSRGPGAVRTGCLLCFLSIPVCQGCRQYGKGGEAWPW